MALSIIPVAELARVWGSFVTFLPRFLVGLLIFAAFYAMYQGTVLLLRAALERRHVHASIISLSLKTYKYFLIIVGAVIALYQMGVRIGDALTGLGIVGVGLGFAAQDTVSNYIAGVTIFWDKPFYVGDYIEVNSLYGRVTEITMRSTRIRTLQNQYLIVPNTSIVNQLVVNHTKNGEVRVEIPFSISYSDSVSKTRSVVLSLVDPSADTRLSQYLRPTVVVTELADSGVNILLRVWVNKAEDELAIRQEYLERIKDALDEQGITIPFPQRVLHVEKNAWQEKQQIPPLEN